MRSEPSIKRKLPFAALLLMAALPACQTEGPAERAGENIDRAVDRAGEAAEETGEDVRDKVD
ncbi:MAG TPA: hypothetical protein VF203_13705 [Burkholderiales bacterium]